MIGRREWFSTVIANALAAWGASSAGGLSSPAMGQSTPSKKGTSNRYTVRKPALSKSKTRPGPRPTSARSRSGLTSDWESCSRRFAMPITCPV